MILGNRTKLAEAQAKGRQVGRDSADALGRNVLPIVRQIQAAGVTGLQGIARALNDRGIRTARGGAWHNSTVRNLLARQVTEADQAVPRRPGDDPRRLPTARLGAGARELGRGSASDR
jgi:hypothetical protein